MVNEIDWGIDTIIQGMALFWIAGGLAMLIIQFIIGLFWNGIDKFLEPIMRFGSRLFGVSAAVLSILIIIKLFRDGL